MEVSSLQSSKAHQNMSTTMVPLQFINHALPIKLDPHNYILWKTQMENVGFENGFEDYYPLVHQIQSSFNGVDLIR